MDSPARAVAFAGIEEEVIVLFDFIQTNFAGIPPLCRERLALEDVVVKVRADLRQRFGSSCDSIVVLGNKILNSAQFDAHSRD